MNELHQLTELFTVSRISCQWWAHTCMWNQHVCGTSTCIDSAHAWS